jgi:DTW domain-containing protein YfiP
VIPIPEGICDECLTTAKTCMCAQFPELFVHESLTPPVP